MLSLEAGVLQIPQVCMSRGTHIALEAFVTWATHHDAPLPNRYLRGCCLVSWLGDETWDLIVSEHVLEALQSKLDMPQLKTLVTEVLLKGFTYAYLLIFTGPRPACFVTPRTSHGVL